MSRFLYHMKPPSLIGDTLVPLNRWKDRDPEFFARGSKKYAGREELMEATIPLLDCLWNDVVHLSPIHPAIVRKGLAEAGCAVGDRQWFRIPVETLHGMPVIYYDSRAEKRAGFGIAPQWCRPFSFDQYQELSELPRPTLNYYREQAALGRPPLLFAGVTHVLVQGEVPLHSSELIEWSRAQP